MTKTVLRLCLLLGVSACGTLSETEVYTKIPYTMERTAGTGVAYSCCAPTEAQLEPAAGGMPPSEMETIFWKQQHSK